MFLNLFEMSKPSDYLTSNLLYSSSVTGSHHSFKVSTPGTSIAKWLNQEFAFAPCQCLTFGGIVTTSPAFRLLGSFPSS